MKNLLVLLPFLVFCNAFAAAPQSEVQPLIKEFYKFEDLCRGGHNISPDDPVCKKRDKISDELYRKGWCNEGPTDDSPSYEFRWQKCRHQTSKKKS